MKKLTLTVALLVALLAVPFTAVGLEVLNNDSMDSVTGQAGVSIAMDDVQMYLNIEKLSYTDDDGLMVGTTQLAGGAEISMGLEMDIITINAITGYDGTNFSSTGMDFAGATNTSMNNFNGTFMPQAISIDVVDALPALSAAISYKTQNTFSKVSGVYITLPTMEVFINNIDINPISITAVDGTGVANQGSSFGTFSIEGVTFTMLSGWMEIAAH